MCLLIKQIDLLLKAIEFSTDITEKETAISLLALITKEGCLDINIACEKKTKSNLILAEPAYGFQET